MKSKVLITGAAGGFGKLTVEALLKKGHSVAASMRDINGKNREAATYLSKAGAKIVEIDVTSNESVEKGVRHAHEQLGGLDVLINNAGVGVLGLQETFTPEDWQKLFNINVFGVQRMNRAVLPAFRENKSGLIIHVSSLLGRITVPFYGPYNASKWALEAMAENYRTETSAFGVECVIVEPGGYPTTFVDNLIRASDSGRNASYGELGHASEGFLKGFEQAMASNPAQKPEDVALAMVQIIETPKGKRPFRTVVDKMGMGDAIGPYNQQSAKMTEAIYGSFGIAGMLSVKT